MTVVKRRFLLRKRVLIPLGCGVALLLLAWFVLLPWVVRWRVNVVLRQLNLDGVTFRVTRATPWTSTVRDLDDAAGNRIDVLRVTYSVEGLWNRRVDNIRVSGLHLTAEVREGRAGIAPLDAILSGSPQPSSQPAVHEAAEEVAATAADWPFRSVRVEDSTLTVRTPQRAIVLPVKATLRWPQLEADVGALKVSGAIGDPRAMSLRLTGQDVSGAVLTTLARALAPEAPVSIPGKVNVTGTLTHTGDETTFEADVVAAGADEPADPDKIAGTNVAVREGVFHVAGTFGGDGTRSLKVNAKDVTLAEASLGATATGVSADVLFEGPNAATRPTQVVRFDKLSAPKLELTDGVVRFGLAPDGTLRIDEARAKFLGGVVSALDVPVKSDQSIPLTLVAADVELRDLLALLAPGKATGEGKVNGRLPMIVETDGSVRLGAWAAEATAGGTLRVLDEQALKQIAGSATANVEDRSLQEQVRQNIVEALKDFQYDSLVAQPKHVPDRGVVANVRIQGKGRTGAQQALDYDLRVTGLEDLLRSAIGVHRQLTREAEKP
jgi:hypothetical protein